MKKHLFTVAVIFFLVFIGFNGFAQTEITYPNIPGATSPQEIIQTTQSQAEVFPLFMAYIFRLMLASSLIVLVAVISYGGILFLFSAENPEKKKVAKSWILGAFQGAFIVLASYSFLYVLDSQLVLFQQRDADGPSYVGDVSLEWNIKNVYYQIPFGLLIEDAALNEKALNKFYNVLDATYEAEDSSDAVVEGSKQLMAIVNACPQGDPCCGESSMSSPEPIEFTEREKLDRVLPDWLSSLALQKYHDSSSTTAREELIFSSTSNQKKVTSSNSNNPLIRAWSSLKTSIKNTAFSARSFVDTVVASTLIDSGEETFNLREELRHLPSNWGPGAGWLERSMEKTSEDVDDEEHVDIDEGHIDDTTTHTEDTTGGVEAGCTIAPRNPNSEIYELAHWDRCGGEREHTIGQGCYCPKDGIDEEEFTSCSDIPGDWIEVPEGMGAPPEGIECQYIADGAIRCCSGELGDQDIEGCPSGYSESGEDPCPTDDPEQDCMIVEVEGGEWWGGTLEICCCSSDVTGECPEDLPAMSDGPCDEEQEEMECEEIQDEEGEVFCCCPEEEEEDPCPGCPIINPPIEEKIDDLNPYIDQLSGDLSRLQATKQPILNDLYQLYKVAMLKSLNHRGVFDYNSLIMERRYYEKEKVIIETNPDWDDWVGNILYETKVDGEIIEENDPTTFYLRRPEANQLIADALRLAKEARSSGLQQIGDFGTPPPLPTESSFKQNQSPLSSLIKNIYNFIKDFIFPGKMRVLAITDMQLLEDYLRQNNIQKEDLTPEKFERIREELNITTEESTTSPRPTPVTSPADYLTCGMEIPVGETFEIVWMHLVELLNTIDAYTREGERMVENQKEMNELAAECECPCENDELCSMGEEFCGSCELTCDKGPIVAAHNEVLAAKENMLILAEHIEFLTDGYFHTPTEDLCDPLNEDIKQDGEGCKLITKHELVGRKLFHSRFQINTCITRPEHLEEAVEGLRAGKATFFGPLVEENDLPRYTKTKRNNAFVNTHELNWFCCSDSREDDN